MERDAFKTEERPHIVACLRFELSDPDPDPDYYRSVVKSVFVSLHRRFDETIRGRIWFGQTVEIILEAAVRNIEGAIKL